MKVPFSNKARKSSQAYTLKLLRASDMLTTWEIQEKRGSVHRVTVYAGHQGAYFRKAGCKAWKKLY